MISNIGVIILSGGLSIRMNYPKQYLLRNGKTFLQIIVQAYKGAGLNNICVVMNKRYCEGKWQKESHKIKKISDVIKNSMPELGRFYSLKLGAGKMKDADFCFIQNVDNPFVTVQMISLLLENKINNGFVSPVYQNKGGHPILVSKAIIKKVISSATDDMNLQNLLKNFKRKKVEINDERILWNINTKEDYERYVLSTEEKIL